MYFYSICALIIAVIQFLWIQKNTEATLSRSDGARIFHALTWAAISGALWPLAILMWLVTYESDAVKEARLARNNNERKRRICQEDLDKERQAKAIEVEKARHQIALEQRAQILWRQYYAMYDESHVSEMSGSEFERFVGLLYSKRGYNVTLTPSGPDQGVDLIFSRGGIKIAVQAKRHSAAVVQLFKSYRLGCRFMDVHKGLSLLIRHSLAAP